MPTERNAPHVDRTLWNFNARWIIASFLPLLLYAGFLPFPVPDAAASDESLVARTCRLAHADVGQLEPVIRTLLSPDGSLSIDDRTNSLVVRDTESSIRVIEETVAELDTQLPARTFQLNYADAHAVAEQIKRVLGTAAGIVEPDPRTHTVYVVSTATNIERIESLVSTWDQRAQQVLIEADILDVSSAKLKELGIEWELRLGYSGGEHDAVFNVGPGRASTDRRPTGEISIGTPSVTIPAVYGPSGNLITPEQVIPGSDFSAAIDALVEDSSTKTLSRPRVLVLDGLPARFEVTTLEPYANTRYNQRGTAASLEIEFLPIGIILETVPHINDEGYILMEVRPEISTLERDEFFDTTIIPNEGGAITNTIRVPVKRQSRASTMVMVRDKQTIAIGGLRTSESTESIRKVPILGDIPVLGIPFRNLNQGRDKRELIIFITPSIVSGGVSSPEVSLLKQTGMPGIEE